MKLTLLKAAAVASVLVFNTAYADSIQVDLNDSGASLTSAFDKLGVFYDSHTVVNVATGAVSTYAGANLVGNNILGLGDVYSSFSDMTNNGTENIYYLHLTLQHYLWKVFLPVHTYHLV